MARTLPRSRAPENAALFVALLVALTLAATACTDALVTPGATASGTAFITYSCDGGVFAAVDAVAGATYAPGAMLDVFADLPYGGGTGSAPEWLGSIPQARSTYRYVDVRGGRSFYHIGGINECGVSIAESTLVGARPELSNPRGMMAPFSACAARSLMTLALERAATAREAVAVAALASMSASPSGSGPTVDAKLAELASQPLAAFIEGSYALLMQRDPDSLWDPTGLAAAEYGVDRYAALSDISPTALQETRRIETEILHLLRTVDRSSLGEADQVSYDAYEWLLEDRIAAGAYPLWDACIGPSTYGVETRQLQLFNVLPVRDAEDAHDYVTRLRRISDWMDQLLAGLAARQAKGVVPTLYVLQAAVQDLTSGVLQDDAVSPDPRLAEAYTTFEQRLRTVAALSSADRGEFLDAAAAAIRDCVFPAYRKLRDALVALQGVATSDVGVARFSDGSDYYAHLLCHYVGSGATAAELHELGLREVARIDAELRDAAATVLGRPRDLPMVELNAEIQSAKTTFPEGAALRREYDGFLAEAQARLRLYFEELPALGLEEIVDPDGPAAYYISPPLDRSGPGLFAMNLLNPAAMTMYDEAVLVYHETVPGHHLEFALALDQRLPTFQSAPITPLVAQHPAFQAFTEGWALYGEHLAAEMGLYDQNPVGNLWRLRLELTRAVRLVADTGMNALGWSWADAATYLEGALGIKQRQSALLRYESAPGQACGYNAGYFLILELRARAQAALGTAFDLREFHDRVLEHGALPLPVLERVISDWIEEKTGHS